jgi:hypothetical protein
MMEPFFGSTPSMWPPVPAALVGWASSPFVNGPAPVLPTAGTIVSSVAMRRGQPAGPTTDTDIEEVLYDAIELLSGTSDVEIRCENGRVTVTGTVPHKRQKRDVGEIAWVIPTVSDVQNNLTIAARRRGRGSREAEGHPAGSARKTA